jgi:hypothetical protein
VIEASRARFTTLSDEAELNVAKLGTES